ncbi:Phospholipase_D-nuclease N-terminal [Desulfocicer vacuolatum DSM 3385]|uniref:Phospholipase_D-nuclease N-terminal n=1 Tax=Desulfocicer vacuolatum DSM 3385 TaxID=1121400 RepID=A0A1W2A431_9BACT|nr:PLDc N-terminal domain-containing protein [Desulfocicer vacuolatum]SMC55435.1 Phospholipase_D-nuclease N-terminal [Desulfocicer vacuolatum DSM 3385]
MDTFVVIAGIGVIFWGLTMLAMVDIILKDFGSIKTKALWGAVSLVPFIGWLIYAVAGAKKGIRKKNIKADS